MKQFHFIVCGLMLLQWAACVKDHSTGIVTPLSSVVVQGLKDTYSVYTHRDTLHIHPMVKNEERYNYYWTAFSTNFVQSHAPKPDTLSKTKNLDYPMLLDPGQYILVMNVEDKQTGVTELIDLNMSVTTLNMNGWYLLKDHGGSTDFDFIYDGGRIDDWIAFYNGGVHLAGDAIKAIYTPSFKTSVTSTDLFDALTVISKSDAGIYRVDNGAKVYGFNEMFFSPPASRHLQNAFQPMNTTVLGLINDNKAYSLTKGALFTDLPSTYKVSPISCSAAMDIGFDENTRSVILFNGSNFASLGSNGDDLKNMDADIVWMNGYAGTRSVAMLLFRLDDGRGLLVKLDAHYPNLASNQFPLILAKDTLSVTHGLMSADAIGGDYDADYIFYAHKNKLYATDLATAREKLQVTLPVGEEISCIQHIKYPQPVDANQPTTIDCLAVASYSQGHYKVWLYKISSTGTVQPLSASFEGQGRVSNITYMEQGKGSRTF